MKLNVRQKSAAIVLLFGLAGLCPAPAQTLYTSQPNASSIKVDGTSTAHAWEMESKIVGGKIEFGPEVTFDPAAGTISGPQGDTIPAKVKALIPVRQIHSKAEHAPEVMDGLMQKALNADDFPTIEFNLTQMTLKGPHAAGTPFVFDTTGNLAIAGTTNKVSFPVTIQPVETNKLKVSATVPLKMTDFKVDPPAPNIGLGLMRCGDDIKIIIDWTLVKRK